MKLVLRILPTLLVLISISAFADTIRINLNTHVGIGPNEGFGDNVGVTLSGQGVSIFALGGTPSPWFDFPQQYFPGDQGLGSTTIFWDAADLQIGSSFYGFDEFDLDPANLFLPTITFPSNGKDFTVRFPWTWALDGTINTDCPSSGCGFLLVGKPGRLSFSYIYSDGVYYASSASFATTPEPGTLTLIAIGIGTVGWRKFRPSR
jgi:hypothetical protein